MKKEKIRLKNNLLLLIPITVFLSIIYVLPLFTNGGLIAGDDMMFHSTRLKMLAEEISTGNLYPMIYRKMFCGYGYAAGLFYPSLLLYPFAVLNNMGLSIIYCIELYFITVNVLTGISFFFCSRAIFKDMKYKDYNFYGFIIFVLSLLDPYKFYNYHGRASFGEFTAMIFAPIVVLGVYYIFKHNKKSYILALGMTGLITCHVLSFVIACIVLIIVYIYNIKKLINCRKILTQTLFAALQCALLSMFVWLPMIEMLFKTDLLVSHTTALYVGPIFRHCLLKFADNDALGIILILIFVAYSIFKKDIYNRLIQLSLFYCFFNSDLFPWRLLSITKHISSIQFPWRLSSIFYFATAYYLYLVTKDIYKNIKERHNLKYNVNTNASAPINNLDTVINNVLKGLAITTYILFMFLYIWAFLIRPQDELSSRKFVTEQECNEISTSALLEYVPYDLAINNREKSLPNLNVIKINNIEYTADELNPGKKVSFVKNFIKSGYEIEYETEDNKICVPIINYVGYETDIEDAEISTTKYGFMKISNIPNSGTVKVIYKGTLFQKLAWIGPSIYAMGIIILLIAQKKKTRH